MTTVPAPLAEPRFSKPSFLASVTSANEARIAVAAGADIVDAKDPSAGALGALKTSAIAAIRAATARPVLMSATIGDLPPKPTQVVSAAIQVAATGVDLVKIGIFPGGSPPATIAALGNAGIPSRLVGLLLADDAPDFDLIEAMAAAGFVGVMLDTARKDGTTLTSALSERRLAEFVGRAHAAGLFAGLAGSLRVSDVPTLMRLEPDVLGFRGALCADETRTRPILAAAASRVRAEIDRAAEAVALRPACSA